MASVHRLEKLYQGDQKLLEIANQVQDEEDEPEEEETDADRAIDDDAADDESD